MTTENGNILKNILTNWPETKVATTHWLTNMGVSQSLKTWYLRNGWLEAIGSGAVKRKGDNIDCWGALQAIQTQLGLAVHIGGKSALAIRGTVHYVPLGKPEMFIYGPPNVKLPGWFKKYDWGVQLHYHTSSLIPPEFSITETLYDGYNVLSSTPERALIECLEAVPLNQGFDETYHFMESLLSLRAPILNTLLSKYSSLKARRLFFVMADRIQPPWLSEINRASISLGHGPRHIIPDGKMDPVYNITIPRHFYHDQA